MNFRDLLSPRICCPVCGRKAELCDTKPSRRLPLLRNLVKKSVRLFSRRARCHECGISFQAGRIGSFFTGVGMRHYGPSYRTSQELKDSTLFRPALPSSLTTPALSKTEPSSPTPPTRKAPTLLSVEITSESAGIRFALSVGGGTLGRSVRQALSQVGEACVLGFNEGKRLIHEANSKLPALRSHDDTTSPERRDDDHPMMYH